jgi:hypothetical protein
MTSQAWEAWAGNPRTDYSLPRVDILQTSGSGATQGGIEIFADPATTNNFYLTHLSVSRLDATNGSYANLYIGTNDIAYLPTLGAAGYDLNIFNFGEPGAAGDVTTTTASVSIIVAGGTCTVQFYAVGKRKR